MLYYLLDASSRPELKKLTLECELDSNPCHNSAVAQPTDADNVNVILVGQRQCQTAREKIEEKY